MTDTYVVKRRDGLYMVDERTWHRERAKAHRFDRHAAYDCKFAWNMVHGHIPSRRARVMRLAHAEAP